jgi:hypothetical protein
MCANGDESNKRTSVFVYNFWTFTIYLTIACNHKRIIHKSIDKEAYMWVGIFCPHGRTKKTNAHVLKIRNVLPLKIALDLLIALNSGV